ncbi:hypothetical protein NADFUDRAFT_84407 [Nadsonia fulvescens var. elongata DSM 6958]|uniref:Uncharacterized protein n=1 Tax=Nadsonia fulvescens var. elongata DSM 6958 TaxID=857566 RepID=A0A1E3PCT3_9ASCO|nr:hypothetical protein NADFUDRAFT_84407 [Nadsonia fulvescens var. elongata DSM 6958]
MSSERSETQRKSTFQEKEPKKNLTSNAEDSKKSKTIEWIFKKGDFLPWVVFTDDIKVAGYIINPKESPMKNVPNKHLFASAIANQWLGKYIRFGGLDNGTKEKIIAKVMVAPLDIQTVRFVTSRLLNI